MKTVTSRIRDNGNRWGRKSSLTDELVRRYLDQFPERTIAIISIDPSKVKTGGALLGDRIRMNAINNPRVYMRSLATRGSKSELSEATKEAIEVVKAAGFDFVIVETSGIGQGDSRIIDVCDIAMYIMTSEFGAATQLEKIDMIDFADLIVINKFERRGSEDALRDVRKQFKRSRNIFNIPDEELPIFGTIASQFNDGGTNVLFANLMKIVEKRVGGSWPTHYNDKVQKVTKKNFIIPRERTGYLGEIVQSVRHYQQFIEEQVTTARKLFQLQGTKQVVIGDNQQMMSKEEVQIFTAKLDGMIAQYETKLHQESKKRLEEWPEIRESYRQHQLVTKVRDKETITKLYTVSLSGNKIPRVSVPKFEDYGEILRWLLKENLPGYFPYTAGVFPFKRTNEDPKRQFAGEGTP